MQTGNFLRGKTTNETYSSRTISNKAEDQLNRFLNSGIKNDQMIIREPKISIQYNETLTNSQILDGSQYEIDF